MSKNKNGRFYCPYCDKDLTRYAIEWLMEWKTPRQLSRSLNRAGEHLYALAAKDWRVPMLFGRYWIIPPFVIWDWARKMKLRDQRGVNYGHNARRAVAELYPGHVEKRYSKPNRHKVDYTEHMDDKYKKKNQFLVDNLDKL